MASAASQVDPRRTMPTLAGVLRLVPALPPERICMNPLPGTASETDSIHSQDQLGFICELVNGTLVRKTVGLYESALAAEIIVLIGAFLKKHRLGRLTGPDGPTRLKKGVVIFPDIAFYSWERLKKSPIKRGTAAAQVSPDLVIEILSPGNTPQEMEDKLSDYLAAKVRLVWYIDPKTKTAKAWQSQSRCTDIPASGALDGSDVLPGFKLNLRQLFASVEEAG